MADLVPASSGGVPALSGGGSAGTTILTPFTDPQGGGIGVRLSNFMAQPAVKKMLPAFIGLVAVGGAALTWSMMAPSPQRTLYSQLDDSNRGAVAAALDQASIKYKINNETGALTVSEGDFYRARMLVASDGALATPETGTQMLDSLPMGASRTLEGQRLRAAREADLQLTIKEIDGVESVRVHLAEGEKSVFVRENVAPSASVMVRLATGRSLSSGQVSAIVNLVSGSVPGLSSDAVRVVDQHGRLLSAGAGKDTDDDRLDLQARMESKLREQVLQLLTPMLGEGNFTAEAQVMLDMNEVTSARESYDKDGVVRSETQQQSQSSAQGQAAGVPGVLSNTPPQAAQVQPGAPQGTPTTAASTPATNGESSLSRTYELGREVSVSNSGPGGVARISVAVAISADAMKGAKAADLKEIEALVGAAVGADAKRGDVVKVVQRGFKPAVDVVVPFYEAPWFAMVVRNGAAVLAVLLVLLIGVRPVVKALRGEKSEKVKAKKAKKAKKGDGEDEAVADEDDAASEGVIVTEEGHPVNPKPVAVRDALSGEDLDHVEYSRAELLSHQLTLAQRLVAERPDSALQAFRQMLNQLPDPAEADAEGSR